MSRFDFSNPFKTLYPTDSRKWVKLSENIRRPRYGLMLSLIIIGVMTSLIGYMVVNGQSRLSSFFGIQNSSAIVESEVKGVTEVENTDEFAIENEPKIEVKVLYNDFKQTSEKESMEFLNIESELIKYTSTTSNRISGFHIFVAEVGVEASQAELNTAIEDSLSTLYKTPTKVSNSYDQVLTRYEPLDADSALPVLHTHQSADYVFLIKQFDDLDKGQNTLNKVLANIKLN